MHIKHFVHWQLEISLLLFYSPRAITTRTATRCSKAIPLLVTLSGDPGKLQLWLMHGGSLGYGGVATVPGEGCPLQRLVTCSASSSPISLRKQTEWSLVAASVRGAVQGHPAWHVAVLCCCCKGEWSTEHSTGLRSVPMVSRYLPAHALQNRVHMTFSSLPQVTRTRTKAQYSKQYAWAVNLVTVLALRLSHQLTTHTSMHTYMSA